MTVWILICTTITLGVAQLLTAARVRDLQARVLDLENPL